MKRFAWDLRVEDPVQIPGAFYSDEGPRGPVVKPGSYVVRLTTRHGAQSVLLDPRLRDTVTAADIAAHWELASKVRADVEALHGAVNQTRTSRTEVEKLQGLTAADRQSKVRNATADFDRRITAVEEQLLQVQMEASEANLRYPKQLNEQYDTFSATIDGDDVRPTEPQQQVFAELHRRLTEQLAKWKSLRDTALPPLKDELQHAGVAGLPVPSGD